MNMLSGVSQLLETQFIFIIVPRLIWDIALFSYLKGFLFVFSRKIKKGEENMKNKFKKSKIIVPALALITATTVASVTGTVAWFTASRTATASLNTFSATAMDSALKVTATAGVGTTNIGGTDTAKTIAVDGNLTHGSYDAKANPNDSTNGGHLYVADTDYDGTTTTITGYRDLNNLNGEKHTGSETTHDWLAGKSNNANVWYGISWTLKFTQDNTNSTKEDNFLFFNPKETTMTGTGDTIKGLKVALMTDSKVLVVGGDSVLTHVDSTVTKDTKEANLPKFVNSDSGRTYVEKGTDVTKVVDYSSSIDSNVYNFGTIDTTNGLTITCVAWFEGTDENVQTTGKTLTTDATTSLSFYSVKKKKTA